MLSRMFQAHSAPLGLVFYDGLQFPEEFRGDAFVALHGSWNSAQPTGYKVVRIPFGADGPAPYYENFVTGFWLRGTSPRSSVRAAGGTGRGRRRHQPNHLASFLRPGLSADRGQPLLGA